jgi:lysophospholipase L1-like esterase
MNNIKARSLTIGLVMLIALSLITAFVIYGYVNKKSSSHTSSNSILVACVGDSITQGTPYPMDLWTLLGYSNYTLENFGVGGTTVSLSSQTPYMNTTAFQNALEFQPNIVIIMLGTNDAQPDLEQYNTSFVGDYVKLVDSFKALTSNPKIWIVLSPPIFGNKNGTIDPAYFASTIIPLIKQVANETNLPTINVYSALANYSADFPDGIHPNAAGAQIIANTIYQAITSQSPHSSAT